MAELDDDKHESYPKDVAARSLLRRLVFWSIQARETEEHEAKMERLDALNVASQNAAQCQRQPASGTPIGQMWQPQPSQVSNVNEAALTALLGNDASALAVAAHMGSVDNTKVVIADILKRGYVDALPYHMQVDESVFQIVYAGAQAGPKAIPAYLGVVAVDLCDKRILPLWVPAESVGGKAEHPSEDMQVHLQGGQTLPNWARR